MKSFYFAFCIALTVCTTQSFGAEAGMPQLNPEFWAAQIFWLLLIFSILYAVIWKIFLPKITDSIENRKSKVVNDLNEARYYAAAGGSSNTEGLCFGGVDQPGGSKVANTESYNGTNWTEVNNLNTARQALGGL